MRRAKNGSGIGMPNENERARHKFECAVERRDIIAKRCQRQRRSDHVDTV
jgi:hypothetical protein